jgi:hypothetical protein
VTIKLIVSASYQAALYDMPPFLPLYSLISKSTSVQRNVISRDWERNMQEVSDVKSAAFEGIGLLR